MLWNVHKKQFKEKEQNVTFERMMTELYNTVHKKWRTLAKSIEMNSFLFDDLQWFEKSDMNVEMKLLFENANEQETKSRAQQIEEKKNKKSKN